ncbi:aminoacyl-tRNA hydrolase [Oceanobacillus halotolerans]|uniref:aminoacyl-tRNA hydrolase n=1 Tax=Oceanobacillus halotolerans TaxID=2663380 RepID=UPI0013DB4E92|nr:aminoacyl-tRNA hydrolase [Oceanobacillus halotolerans]
MKCIAGLGNPGKKYENTRHNVGFMVIDELAKRHNWQLNKQKYNGNYAIERLNGEKVMVLQPQTYMNLSGEAVRPLLDYFDIPVEDVLIIYDDLDLPTGKIRLRQKGGHGGHNGIRSVIDHLGTKDFKRIRIGVGRPISQSIIDYVLGTFPKSEMDNVATSIQKSADACETWLTTPFDQVMNEFNQ